MAKKTKPKKSTVSKKVVKKKPPAKKAVTKKPVTSKKKPPAKKPASPSYRSQGAISISELEIIRRDSDKFLSGRKIQSIEVLDTEALVSPLTRAELKKALVGIEIATVNRCGMSLIIEFVKNQGWLVVTLGDGGQLRRHTARDALSDACILSISFLKGGQLRVNSHLGDTKLRFVGSKDQADALLALKGKGMDIVETPIPKEFFVARLRIYDQTKTIKETLSDPDLITGLGDIYCDEVLYKSGLKYDRSLSSVPDIKLILLLRNLSETLYEAVKYRGNTLEGGFFCDLEGTPGSFQDYLQVYGRDGEETSTLHEVKKDRFKNRWAYYCPALQQ